MYSRKLLTYNREVR